jgi:hypothetical protein
LTGAGAAAKWTRRRASATWNFCTRACRIASSSPWSGEALRLHRASRPNASALHAPGQPRASHPRRYGDFDALTPLLTKHLAIGDNLLVVGPGLSALHERLYDR